MPTVRFLPADLVVEVPEGGMLLHEAAILAGLETLHLPCGGEGTCGQCLVEVVSGAARPVARSTLQAALQGEGLVLACQTRVERDTVVRLPQRREAARRVAAQSDVLVSEGLLPSLAELSPLARAERLTIAPASIEEHYSDWLRLSRALGLSPIADLELLRGLAAILRADGGRITAVLADQAGAGARLLGLTAGHDAPAVLGLAVDVGTTTVSVQLVSLQQGQRGRVLGSRTAYNGQIARGADIITRIDYARTDARLGELSRLVLETINGLSDELLADQGAAAEQAVCAFLAGNTTMIHLLLGLPPQQIREAPYVPTVNPVPPLTGAQVGLRLHSRAEVRCAPGVGSYVGGDITAGILCTEITSSRDEVFLFIDVGTNGEIALGNAEWLVTCACSAGPAFEGSGIKCGMRAERGAIEQVELIVAGPGGCQVRHDVIGGGAPAGVCGSGLIALLGQLFLGGLVDRSGQLTDACGERLVQVDGARGFLLAGAAEAEAGRDLVITEPDIENLIRTKAAIYSACSLLLDNVGLSWEALARVYVAGGFGRYIRLEEALLVGMLPDLPRERFTYLGNSALAGAYIALLSAEHRALLDATAARMTYLDLSSEPGYMDAYMSAAFLPHTDLERFPSVARRLRG